MKEELESANQKLKNYEKGKVKLEKLEEVCEREYISKIHQENLKFQKEFQVFLMNF